MLKFPPNVDLGSLIMEVNVNLVNTAVSTHQSPPPLEMVKSTTTSMQALILTNPSQVQVPSGTNPLRDSDSLINLKRNH